MFKTMIENVEEKTPLVHCITNYVTVNDCANALLAVKGSPIMADDEDEVEDITSICNALVINIGTLNKRTLGSMIKAGKKANALGHQVILDPVGAGASPLRTNATFQLLKEVKFSVIRGNISEIKTVYQGSGTTKGVDADVNDVVTKDNLQESVAFAKALSKNSGAVIAITGAIDIVANEKSAYAIYNGHKDMSKISGTGCMLSAILGAYAAANPTQLLEASVCGVAHMGYSGELAQARVQKENGGNGSFHMYIIDELSKMTPSSLLGGMKVEVQ
ncbi:MAG: hydroxyethylthiazole kinase [Longicatena sp.]